MGKTIKLKSKIQKSIQNRVSKSNHAGHKITLIKIKESSPCLLR